MDANEFQLEIPEDAWEPNDALDDPRNALRVTLYVNGMPMHFEAWEVTPDEDGIQFALAPEYEGRLDELHSAVSADGSWYTQSINGREYVLVASPYCQ